MKDPVQEISWTPKIDTCLRQLAVSYGSRPWLSDNQEARLKSDGKLVLVEVSDVDALSDWGKLYRK